MHNILYLDVFSEDTSFIVQGKKNFRTWFGVFLSICLMVASIILTIKFGQEVYQRKKPSVSISEEYLAFSRVEMTDYPLFIIFSNYKGEKIENIDGYYTIKSYKMNFTEDGYSDFAGNTPFHPVVKCKSKHFDTVRGKISDSKINEIVRYPSFCIEYDYQGILQNPYKSANSTFLDIDIVMCNKTARTCADDFDFIIKEAYVQLYLLNTSIDSLDFSNSVKYYYESLNTQITDTYLKRNFISINTNQYISDDGWILEDSRTMLYYSVGNVKSEVNNIAANEPLSVLWNTIDSSYLRKNTIREYLKVQDLFAKIGGIVNAFMIIIQILFSHYLRYNFNMNLRQHLNPSTKNFSEKRSTNLLNIHRNIIDYSSSNIVINKANNNEHPYTQRTEDITKRINKLSTNNLNRNTNNTENRKDNDKQETKDEQISSINDNKKSKLVLINKIKNNNNNSKKDTLTNNYLKSRDNDNINKSDIDNSKSKNALRKFDSETSSIDYIKQIKELKEINEENKKQLSLNLKKDMNNLSISNVSDLSIFNFDYIDFSKLNYFKYIHSMLLCNKKLKLYNGIKNEIEHLLDFYVYCNYLKHQYLIKDPRDLKE